MSLATQTQLVANCILFEQLLVDQLPSGTVLRQQIHIADDVESLLGPRQRHAYSIFQRQVADFVVVVTANQRQQNDSALLALIVVHHGYANPFQIRILSTLLRATEIETFIFCSEFQTKRVCECTCEN